MKIQHLIFSDINFSVGISWKMNLLKDHLDSTGHSQIQIGTAWV